MDSRTAEASLAAGEEQPGFVDWRLARSVAAGIILAALVLAALFFVFGAISIAFG